MQHANENHAEVLKKREKELQEREMNLLEREINIIIQVCDFSIAKVSQLVVVLQVADMFGIIGCWNCRNLELSEFGFVGCWKCCLESSFQTCRQPGTRLVAYCRHV